ncbi:MAG: hypothetical protein JSS22_03275 [Proteobacteria bacterium]|nr:hypothetical protein [Pseudomonadota bacterium]
MTLVIAAQFGARILAFSDTMISNESTGNTIIPGRLKSVILNGSLSVSYSGNACAALDVVRKVREDFLKSQNLADLCDFLATNSSDCEFIVISHLASTPRLFKIAKGCVSTGASRYWIGTPDPIRRLAEIEESLPMPIGYAPNGVSTPEEDAFRRAIQHLLFEPVAYAKSGIGGFLVELLGSPFGHCYGGHAMMK